MVQGASAMASIVGKGDAEGLRKVEKDVLITKKVKHKAMENCSDLVKGTKINVNID